MVQLHYNNSLIMSSYSNGPAITMVTVTINGSYSVWLQCLLVNNISEGITTMVRNEDYPSLELFRLISCGMTNTIGFWKVFSLTTKCRQLIAVSPPI